MHGVSARTTPELAPLRRLSAGEAWTQERLERFARAAALRDRAARQSWICDAVLEGAFRGFARCVAVVTGTFIVLTAEEVD